MKNLVVTINGRDAVPVRALCFVDNLKRLSPDLVAQAAAGEDHYEGTWRLPTYHLSEGRTAELKASQWAYCCRRLKSISSRLKSTWGGADSWDLWRSEATPVLPAGVFVWLDEFREWYGRTRPWKVKKAYLLLAHPEGDEHHDSALKEVLESMERPWDVVGDDLSLVQPISESDYCMAMEGFPLAPALPTAPTPEQPAGIVPEQAQHQGDDQQGGSIALWQVQVREIADELHRKDQRAKVWSSIEDISERVATEAIERGILGPRGQLTAANIRRTALQGGRWKRPTD